MTMTTATTPTTTTKRKNKNRENGPHAFFFVLGYTFYRPKTKKRRKRDPCLFWQQRSRREKKSEGCGRSDPCVGLVTKFISNYIQRGIRLRRSINSSLMETLPTSSRLRLTPTCRPTIRSLAANQPKATNQRFRR